MLAQWRSTGFSAGLVPSSIHIAVIVLYLVGSLCTGNVLCINIAGRHRDRANRARFAARTVTVVMDFGIGITAGFMDVGLKTKVSVSMAVASVLVLRLRLCLHVRLNGNVQFTMVPSQHSNVQFVLVGFQLRVRAVYK